jgi:peptidase M1-like protein
MPALLILALLTSDSTPRYWQQRVAYDIAASLDEPSGVLSGNVRIHYVNQSPDTLRDFYVHQYLNAFRPGSRWAAVDSAEQRVRFQHMKDPDYAFERITRASLGVPDYPYAPDSTIAHWRLPRPLAPGDSIAVDIQWQARPSTLPRRQGRRGRRFDFAQWYPKVVVYDKYGWEDHPLYPAGEFYGEFASYDVTLDVAADQVVGATGVPVEGDPGWQKAAVGAVASGGIDYQRDYYGRSGGQNRCGQVSTGRKCVRFYADSVHHFALSLNPDYRYEQGRYKDVVVHVLYQPQDSATWGKGVAVQNTEIALMWLDSLYGKFAWPQITNVHRIEGGGTEFPMMIMDGGPGLGLIVHELGHNYTMGILANNEWREGYLDEGFTSFQTDWFFEAHTGQSQYADVESYILLSDLDRWSEPVSMISERYRDFDTYNDMIYEKGALFYAQLRYIVGDDVMRQILRTYYARYRLRHVDEQAFRSVAEEVSHQDLKWLFGQWLHGTPLIDYRFGKVHRQHLPDGRWRTTAVVERLGDGWMPVEIGDKDTVYTRASGQAEREQVEFITTRKPKRLILDPHQRAHDWNALNNHEPRGLFRSRTGPSRVRLDNPTRTEVRRDRVVSQLLPVAWSNDFGGATVGLRRRENYLGRFNTNNSVLSYGFDPDAAHRLGWYARFGNPVSNPMPRTDAWVAGWNVEGRAGAAIHADRSLRQHQSFGPDTHAGFDAIWMAVSDVGYLDRSLWDIAGTIEAGPWGSITSVRGNHVWHARAAVRGGVVYRNPGAGVQSSTRYDLEGLFRGTAEASLRTPYLGVRLFGGAALAQTTPPLQRRIMLGGADPYTTFTNPLLRSRGALFVRPDFHYQAPGDANLRAFRPDLGGRWALGVNIEATKRVYQRRSRNWNGLFSNVTLEAFADAGLVDTLAVPAAGGQSYTTLYDGGIGVVTRHRINELAWTMRFEVPFVVNRWDYAADGPDKRVRFRWQVSLEPSF